MSCPAPFCPPGGAVYCQPEAATPVDCGQAHYLAQGLRPADENQQRDGRELVGGMPPGDRRAAASSRTHSQGENSHALKAWLNHDAANVNDFTNEKRGRKVPGQAAAPHPLAQAVGQWQRQAQQTHGEASPAAPRSAVRQEASGSAVAGAESRPPLPCPADGQEGKADGRDDGGRSRAASFRQAAQEELRAWRRPARRQTSSVALPAQDETPLSDRRLNKVIAEAGYCSRRKADELIFAGRVSVNGEVETHAGRRVSPDDCVSVDGRPLARAQQQLCLMLHKPVQVVSTAADPQGRQTVLSLVARDYPGVRLFPVGRLDYFSEGLILLTNDGRLAQRLMHPRHHLPKRYEVLVRNVVTQKALQTMRSGMRLAEGEELLPVEVTARSTASGCTLLRMVLRQGVNRQIRRMCRDLGLTILRLRRVAVGPLQLGTLAPGHYRQLEEGELAALRQAVGIR